MSSPIVWQHNKDQDLAGYANISYKPMLFQREVEFTGGGLYRYKTRDNYYNEYALQSDTSATFHTISTVPLAFQTSLEMQPGAETTAINANSYTAHEKIAAGFIQAKFDLLKRLQLLGGVRVENTQQDYTTVMPLTFSGAYGTIHYTDVLPSVHFKYLLADNQNLRLSYFKSISRPGFGEIDPYLLHGEVFDEIGNPNLKHVRADNLDLRYELFPGLTDQILVGAFYKNLQDPIEYFASRTSMDPARLYIQPQNTDHATNFGFEGVITKFFGILGISANYTYTHSRRHDVQTGHYEFAQPRQAQGIKLLDSCKESNNGPFRVRPTISATCRCCTRIRSSVSMCNWPSPIPEPVSSQVSRFHNLDIWAETAFDPTLELSLEKRIVKSISFSSPRSTT